MRFHRIILLLFLISCSTSENQSDLEKFNKCIGYKYSRIIADLVRYSDSYIVKRFSIPSDSLHIGYETFIISVDKEGYDFRIRQYDTTTYKEIERSMRNSGLYYELYCETELDSRRTSIDLNRNGDYLNCLKNVESSDSTIITYIESCHLSGGMSPENVARGLLHSASEATFRNRLIHVIIAIEFFT